ncbi:hypothetical protein BDR04DRAFT_1112125 [Suillus decipiens]|nr:hypothetical protein BDR04DRAFT_1112125 [Suillus decipiens]
MGITLDTAALLGLFLESLLYGVFLTLYLFMLFILLRKTGIQRRLILPVATLLLCIATAYVIIEFVQALEGFVFKADTISASGYYSNTSPLLVATTALSNTQIILADAIVVWRCYVLNNRSLLVAIPGCIMLLASVVTGCYTVVSLSLAHPLSNLPPADRACIITFGALTMGLSIATTSLNAWRIYRTRCFMPQGFNAAFLPVLVVIIESGTLYSTTILILLITIFIESNDQYVMVEIIPPIVGITFCLIILQVHFDICGNSPAGEPIEVRGTITSPFRERGVRKGFSMERMTMHIIKEPGTIDMI